MANVNGRMQATFSKSLSGQAQLAQAVNQVNQSITAAVAVQIPDLVASAMVAQTTAAVQSTPSVTQ